MKHVRETAIGAVAQRSCKTTHSHSSQNRGVAPHPVSGWALALALVCVPIASHAQEGGADDVLAQADENVVPRTQLPEPSSEVEERPPAPGVGLPSKKVVRQAGVGSPVAYARAGVLELGGSAFVYSGENFTQLSLNPSIGWFFMDNLQISGIFGANYQSIDGAESTFVSFAVEPSFHVPFTENLFGFAGIGAGISYTEGPGTGFLLAPRLGANVMIGRSGILTPALQLNYSTQESIATPQGNVLAINVTYGLSIGYTVMF